MEIDTAKMISVAALVVTTLYYGTTISKYGYDSYVLQKKDEIAVVKDELSQCREAVKINISGGIIAFDESVGRLNDISRKLYSQVNVDEINILREENRKILDENIIIKKENNSLKENIFEYKINGKEYSVLTNNSIELLGRKFIVSLKSLSGNIAYLNATIGDKKVKNEVVEVGDSFRYDDDLLSCEVFLDKIGSVLATFKLYCVPKIKANKK